MCWRGVARNCSDHRTPVAPRPRSRPHIAAVVPTSEITPAVTMEAHGRSRSADTLADLRAVFETEFWTDSGASSSSEDEGIGSDDSMETGHREGSEGGDTVTAGGEAGRNHDSGNSGSGGDKTFRSQIKRSKSLVAIAQFRSRLLQHISRRFQDDGGGGGEQAASGESRIDVFGLDLSEICAKTGTEVPDIVTFCIQKIEKLGITDGIYRISGQHQQESNLDNLFSPEKTLTLKSLFET